MHDDAFGIHYDPEDQRDGAPAGERIFTPVIAQRHLELETPTLGIRPSGDGALSYGRILASHLDEK
jgi:hypothetical protein